MENLNFFNKSQFFFDKVYINNLVFDKINLKLLEKPKIYFTIFDFYNQFIGIKFINFFI
jgi:hypothetical protein